MLGNEDKRFVGIDSFAFRDASLEKVEANLARYGLARPELLVGDAFELVPVRCARRHADRCLVLRRRALLRGAARGASDRRAAARARGARHRRRHGLGRRRSRDGRLSRRATASAANPHDRRQVTRCPSVVGGDAGARLGRRGGELDQIPRIVSRRSRTSAVRVVQRERRRVGHALRDAAAAETESGGDRAVSKKRRALLADLDQATRPEHTPGHPDGRADGVVRAVAADVQSDERRRRARPERVDRVSRVDRSRGPAERAPGTSPSTRRSACRDPTPTAGPGRPGRRTR